MQNSFVNTDKKGTIILTHYRSGGTQLRHIIDIFLNFKNIPFINVGEIDVDINSSNFEEKINDVFFSNSDYKIIQLNNPLVISFCYYKDIFSELKEDFHIVHLERDDASKCLLSLPLWEKFIQEGHYEKEEWTKDLMIEFHNKLLDRPLRYTQLYTGLHSEYHPNNGIAFANYIVMSFVNILAKNRNISNIHKINTFFYEEYEEYTKDFFVDHFIEYNEVFLNRVKDTYKRKIPYISSDYLVYFDKEVNKVFENWGLK